jgi:hypothetical protein
VVEGGGAGGGDDGQAFEEFPEPAGAFLRFEEYAVATDGGEADGFAVANLLVGEGGSDFDGVLFGGLVAVARLDGTLHVEEEPDADGGLEVEFLDHDAAGAAGAAGAGGGKPVDALEGVAGDEFADGGGVGGDLLGALLGAGVAELGAGGNLEVGHDADGG